MSNLFSSFLLARNNVANRTRPFRMTFRRLSRATCTIAALRRVIAHLVCRAMLSITSYYCRYDTTTSTYSLGRAEGDLRRVRAPRLRKPTVKTFFVLLLINASMIMKITV